MRIKIECIFKRKCGVFEVKINYNTYLHCAQTHRRIRIRAPSYSLW